MKITIPIKKRAIKKAAQSTCHHRVSALGFNSRGECVLSTTNKSRFLRKGGGEHAEAILMRSAKKYGIKKILICRIGRDGKLLPIDPCDMCQKIADKLNISIYTIENCLSTTTRLKGGALMAQVDQQTNRR